MNNKWIFNKENLYTLVAQNSPKSKMYSIEKGHGFDQYWYYSKEVARTMLQVTKWDNGRFDISVQGAANTDKFYYGKMMKNFIDFTDNDFLFVFKKAFPELDVMFA